MIIPPYLNPGDKIALVATARKISREEIQPAIEIIKGWGLEPVLGNNLFKCDHQFSGTDAERTEDFQRAINNPSIKAVIIARGGYGTIRVIDAVDFSQFISHPKWVIGFSDITVFHQHIYQNFGIASLHATMPFNFEKSAEATETLRKALFGEQISYSCAGQVINRLGECEAEIVGGNLSLMYALTGSKSDIDTRGKILFIEDLDEYLYHVDRMMMNLKRSGKLSHLKGLIVGGMTQMKDNTIPFGKTAEEIILGAVSEYGYPVCFNFPAGHIDRNFAIYIGKKALLEVHSGNVNLKFL
jgi:muramoyltetrapeptide carboxypeptidase